MNPIQATLDNWVASGITPPSFLSVFLEFRFGETQLASGTGFLVKSATSVALITARHNVTGRNQHSGDCLHSKGGVPNNIVAHLPGIAPLSFVTKKINIVGEDGASVWLEHPILKENCDVIALRLDDTRGVFVATYSDFSSADDIAVGPAEQVSVIGFPMGQSAGGMLAIWCSGYVASEPSQDYAGQPQFLIDSRTRQGQSGSPVIAYRSGQYGSAQGGVEISGGPSWRLLGVYTGRIHPDADVGVVWKWRVVEELCTALDLQIAGKIREMQDLHPQGSKNFQDALATIGLKQN